MSEQIEIYISIHAPTRGATSLCLNCCIKKEFQSTLPREERRFMRPDHFSHHVNFNPRSHERSDGRINLVLIGDVYFNPRSHERSDFARIICLSARKNFNPRSHERSDVDFKNVLKYHKNFNPRSHERSDYKEW